MPLNIDNHNSVLLLILLFWYNIRVVYIYIFIYLFILMKRHIYYIYLIKSTKILYCVLINLWWWRFCYELDSLDEEKVKGKVVLCDWSGGNGSAACIDGAAGIIMQDSSPKDYASVFPIPASSFDSDVGTQISLYLNTTRYILHNIYILINFIPIWITS